MRVKSRKLWFPLVITAALQTQFSEKSAHLLAVDYIPTSLYAFAMTNKQASANSVTVPVRTRLLDAAVLVIREKGYCGTSVDDLCAAAGVTKGAFFHHFKTKEELAVAAADYWTVNANSLFSSAPFQKLGTAHERVLGYIDFRAEIIRGTTAQFTCLAGTMAQETFQTSPAIRDACYTSISGHAGTLERDIADALPVHHMDKAGSAKSLALHTQAVLQGAFVLAKAMNDPVIAIDSIVHLRRYFEFLFDPRTNQGE
jgi:TetR/AcrR family transcriptional repressor of nem operon